MSLLYYKNQTSLIACSGNTYNESTAGADASVEALKLYHMKLTCSASANSSHCTKTGIMIVTKKKF